MSPPASVVTVTTGDLPDRVLRGRHVLLGDVPVAASLHIRDGRISAIAGYDEVPAGCPVTNLGDALVMAGLVDTHVHINEPGRTDWEGFRTATRAALAGGVTTLMDMPLNSLPPTTSMSGLQAKAAAAEGQLYADVALCGGVIPGNVSDVPRLARGGVLAFKCFLADSGVPEFPPVGEDDLKRVLPQLADLGLPLLVHAELPGPLSVAERALRAADPRRYEGYLLSRPRSAEDQAVALILRLCQDSGARAHIVHLSSADALPLLRRARDAGVPLSAETCPHYLSFAAESIPDGATAFKCAPPIREAANRERLWGALREGLLMGVVTDHSPSTPSLKCAESGDFTRAWGGIASLQLGLAAVWTGARARGLTPADVARWMCEGPARLVGLWGRKGALAVGCDADLVVWDPEDVFTVAGSTLYHRHKLTPYDGQPLRGVVHATYLRGERVYDAAAPDPFLCGASGTWLRGPLA